MTFVIRVPNGIRRSDESHLHLDDFRLNEMTGMMFVICRVIFLCLRGPLANNGITATE
jgi:hypothetical protein